MPDTEYPMAAVIIKIIALPPVPVSGAVIKGERKYATMIPMRIFHVSGENNM